MALASGPWMLVKDSSGTIWAAIKGTPIPNGVQSYQIQGDPNSSTTFGPSLHAGLTALGATPAQAGATIQGFDVGALFKGGTKAGFPASGTPGQTFPQLGGATSGSGAVPAGIDISSPLSGVISFLTDAFNTAISDLKYGAVLVLVLLVGGAMMYKGISGIGSKA